MTVFVGGVGELYQGDLDLGRLAVERLLTEEVDGLGRDVVVEELHYGAVAVTQRIAELQPTTLVLVGAVRRGRRPGAVERRRVHPPALGPDDLQAAVGDAVVGYVGLDLVIEVVTGLGALPPHTVSIEVEPAGVGPGEGLSGVATEALETALGLVRREVGRAPLRALAADLRSRRAEGRLAPSASTIALDSLLDELAVLDEGGRWGHAFARRDELRLALATGRTSEEMDHHDWALWWAMLEELDRLQAAEAHLDRSAGSLPPG